MRSGGARHHHSPSHHHHHHAPVGAILTGAAIGAAVSRSRQPQYYTAVPVTTVPVTAVPVGTAANPLPPSYSSAPKKKAGGQCVIVCAFLLAIILCAVLIPWPGTIRYAMVPGSQQLNKFNGAFIEKVMVNDDSNSTSVFFFDSEPPLTANRVFNNYLQFPSTPYWFTEIRFDLFGGSSVDISWTYSGCTLVFMVLQGDSRHNTYLNGGNPSTYYYLRFAGPQSFTVSISSTDHYYFIIENPSSNCYPLSTAYFVVNARSYDTSNPIQSCTANNCVSTLDYGERKYIVLQPPAFTSQGVAISVYYDLTGVGWTYALLYLSLIFGMCCCSVCVRKFQKKHENTDEMQRLIPPPNVPSVHVEPYQPQPQPGQSLMYQPSYPAQSQLPPYSTQEPQLPYPQAQAQAQAQGLPYPTQEPQLPYLNPNSPYQVSHPQPDNYAINQPPPYAPDYYSPPPPPPQSPAIPTIPTVPTLSSTTTSNEI